MTSSGVYQSIDIRNRTSVPRICGDPTILIEASVKFKNVGTTSSFSPAASNSAASHNDKTFPLSCAKHSFHDLSCPGFPSTPKSARDPPHQRQTSLPGIKSVSFKKYPSVYNFSECIFMKLKIGCNSGSVSRSTSTLGGLYGCNILSGLIVDRAPVCALGGGGESFEGPDICASEIEVNVSRLNFDSRFADSLAESGEDLEERRFVKDADHAVIAARGAHMLAPDFSVFPSG